ncbi:MULTISPECIES: hypothetical protein [Burkholderia]|uniref:hypothetical protein n=1 Tax=Burkholderia TaxID=32008 RepID=UPI0014561B59|nr:MULTISPECIES: hypothetical protein [Burkholderia]
MTPAANNPNPISAFANCRPRIIAEKRRVFSFALSDSFLNTSGAKWTKRTDEDGVFTYTTLDPGQEYIADQNGLIMYLQNGQYLVRGIFAWIGTLGQGTTFVFGYEYICPVDVDGNVNGPVKLLGATTYSGQESPQRLRKSQGRWCSDYCLGLN